MKVNRRIIGGRLNLQVECVGGPKDGECVDFDVPIGAEIRFLRRVPLSCKIPDHIDTPAYVYVRYRRVTAERAVFEGE